MTLFGRSIIPAALALALVAPAVPAQEDSSMDDAQAYRWNLADIYPDEAAWQQARQDVESRLVSLAECQGHLTESAARLKGCLDSLYGALKEMQRVESYASMLSDEDTRAARPLELRQEASLLGSHFASVTSFIEPELLAAGEARIDELLAADPSLELYRHALEDTLRRKPHTLGEEAEGVIADASLMSDAPYSIYSILANADMPWPTVTLSDGTSVRLDQSGYTRWRATENRADRKLVFDTFWKTWKEWERTCGVTLYSQVKRDMFYAKARNYPNALAAALDRTNVPEAVYRTLIAATNDGLPTLYRYFKLRGRMLGITDLRYYDIYPPLVTADLSFPVATGEKVVLDALAPLGKDYVDTVRRGFGQRWMDVFPQPGKRSGAYSNGSVYDVHPYVLMNYNDDYESVSTMAHEWGHAMHSYLANAAQPFATSDYSIFVAEVASTFNEALLLDHMLATAKDDTERLYYLGSALEGLRGTFFRQAMFAEFELRIHELVEKGEALSGQRLTKEYGELLRRYHGQDQGVLTVDDAYTVEWAYIPHFYYNFYVYQYATSLAASSLFADEVLAGRPGARERYLSVLESGGSAYPYQLLKDAGVDLATPAPYESLLSRMNRIMDEIETILARRKGGAAR